MSVTEKQGELVRRVKAADGTVIEGRYEPYISDRFRVYVDGEPVSTTVCSFTDLREEMEQVAGKREAVAVASAPPAETEPDARKKPTKPECRLMSRGFISKTSLAECPRGRPSSRT